MADHSAVLREHGYHPLRVARIVQETADTRSFVLDVPADLRDLFAYHAGQFCTFRVTIGGEEHLRCYSMSSAPATDADLTVTVKRVPGGLVSNWLHDHVSEGDTLEVTKPAGVFCLAEHDAPIVAFCGGSGVTPVFSIVHQALATTTRRVKVLYANRDQQSVIFAARLDALCAAHPDRLQVRHHLDDAGGFLQRGSVVEFLGDAVDPDVFICGPAPFMDLVESAVLDAGIDASHIAIERFVVSGAAPEAPAAPAPPATDAPAPDGGDAEEITETVTLILRRKKTTVPYKAGDTVLDTARRAGLQAPFSCEAGNCATCMAFVTQGAAQMRANNALTPAEVAEGWVLTCQALPIGRSVTIEYEPM